MTIPTREFKISKPGENPVWLRIGVAGPSSSGKTYSALRLATGIQRVTGGKIFGIDTEKGRMYHYHKAKLPDGFEFEHVPMDAPFSPLDYLAALTYAISKGARIIVIDSMTHEHNGDGGVMDQVEKILQEKYGDDENARQKGFLAAQKGPKAQRRVLNNAIDQMEVHLILCYRADDKVKPVTGQGVKSVGLTPETTSNLVYSMTQCFLLPRASDGKPLIHPNEDAEKRLVKNPAQFRGWFADGMQLNEEMGEKMAKWAGVTKEPQRTKRQQVIQYVDDNKNALTPDQLQTVKLMIPGAKDPKRDDFEMLTAVETQVMAFLAQNEVTEAATTGGESPEFPQPEPPSGPLGLF